MSFGVNDYPFNANRSLPPSASLGVFSAAQYSSTYGTGGDDTAAVQAALNAASSAGGGVAFLPTPVSGFVNVSRGADGLAQSLSLGTNGVWLIGASSGVNIRVVPGSNVDWIVSTATHNVVDYRTVCVPSSRPVTYGGYTYQVLYLTGQISSWGGIANIVFTPESTGTNLGHVVMLNCASNFSLDNILCMGSPVGEVVSMWDCYNPVINRISHFAAGTGTTVGIHRLCYNTQSAQVTAIGNVSSIFKVYTEQFTPTGQATATYTPMFTKISQFHTVGGLGADMQGALFVNLDACTDELGTPQNQVPRYGAPTYGVVQDGGAVGGVQSVTAGSNVYITGTPTNPIINSEGVQSVSAGANITVTGTPMNPVINGTAAGVTAVTASAPLASSGGATPNLSLSGIVPVASGGTGTQTPALVQGTNITITGTWPNQTINSVGAGILTPTHLTFGTASNGLYTANQTFSLGATDTIALKAFIWKDGNNDDYAIAFGTAPGVNYVVTWQSDGNVVGYWNTTGTFATRPSSGNFSAISRSAPTGNTYNGNSGDSHLYEVTIRVTPSGNYINSRFDGINLGSVGHFSIDNNIQLSSKTVSIYCSPASASTPPYITLLQSGPWIDEAGG